MMYYFDEMSVKQIAEIQGVSEGTVKSRLNYARKAIKNSVEINELFDTIKTKRYTHSRIRRAVLSMMFGVNVNDILISAPYCRLLGFNTKISAELGRMVEKCKIPFVVNHSDFFKFSNPDIKTIFELECKTTDIYNLMLKTNDVCSKEMTYSPKKV